MLQYYLRSHLKVLENFKRSLKKSWKVMEFEELRRVRTVVQDVKRCVVQPIIFKQQTSSVALYSCCSCCVLRQQMGYFFFLKRVKCPTQHSLRSADVFPVVASKYVCACRLHTTLSPGLLGCRSFLGHLCCTIDVIFQISRTSSKLMVNANWL